MYPLPDPQAVIQHHYEKRPHCITSGSLEPACASQCVREAAVRKRREALAHDLAPTAGLFSGAIVSSDFNSILDHVGHLELEALDVGGDHAGATVLPPPNQGGPENAKHIETWREKLREGHFPKSGTYSGVHVPHEQYNSMVDQLDDLNEETRDLNLKLKMRSEEAFTVPCEEAGMGEYNETLRKHLEHRWAHIYKEQALVDKLEKAVDALLADNTSISEEFVGID